MTLRLKTQYALAIVAVIVITTCVLTAVLMYGTTRSADSLISAGSAAATDRLVEQMYRRGETAARLVAGNILNAFYFLDMEEMELILTSAKTQPGIVFAYVYEPDGTIIHDGTHLVEAHGKSLDDELVAGVQPSRGASFSTDETNNILTVVEPLKLGDEVIGGVALGFSLAPIYSDIAVMERELSAIGRARTRSMLIALGLLSALTIAFGVLIAFRVAGVLAGPIGRLSSAAAAIGRQDWNDRLTESGSLEIVELAESFNDMAEDLKRHRDNLEGLVAERTAQLSETNKRLLREKQEKLTSEAKRRQAEERLQRAQKMEALGMLAGGVAHDLNNILSGIVNYPELLLRELPEDSDLVRPLGLIKNSGERAAAVVEDLLTMARRGVATLEVLSLNDIVNEYVSTPEFAKLVEESPKVAFENRLSIGLPLISGSRVHLMKMLMNLVMNACEAMPDGGTVVISTSCTAAGAPRSGDGSDPDSYAVLEIADSGEGIAPENLEKIFEPFFTKKKLGRSGSGLGMAVVWGTVQDHGGYIETESKLKEGTRFTLHFPITEEAPKEAHAERELKDYAGNGEPILVVDDLPEQREIAVSILRLMGYRADSVASGEEALDYLRENECELLLLDMLMDPGMDGLDTYRSALQIRPRLPAIIVSGYAESERVRKAQELGASGYVRKPYLASDLGEAVQSALNGG
ncbi:response regulator [bacterium]|nr:response regulator [bacterium]